MRIQVVRKAFFGGAIRDEGVILDVPSFKKEKDLPSWAVKVGAAKEPKVKVVDTEPVTMKELGQKKKSKPTGTNLKTEEATSVDADAPAEDPADTNAEVDAMFDEAGKE